MKNKLITSVVVLFLLGGCGTVRKGFIGEESEYVDPFADATIELMTLQRIEFRRTDLVYLRPYYEADVDAMSELSELLDEIDRYRDDIVVYSLELVRISSAYPTGAEKCNALADDVAARADDEYRTSRGIGPEEFIAMAEALRAQDNFLACLRTIQPMIERSGEIFEDRIVHAENALVPQLVERLDAAIEEEYGTVVAQLDRVYARRDSLFRQLQALDGESDDGADERTRIIEKLEQEERLLSLMSRDVDDYKATRAELESEVQEILDALELARRQGVTWVRAHGDLAEGIRNPGRWLSGMFQVANAYKRIGR